MATEKQIAANRANAQLSTGPKTEAGRAASSHNATTHSLTAKGLIILPGHEADFAQLEAGLRASLQPDTPLQEVFFKRIVDCAWKLERCRFAEQDISTSYGFNIHEPLSDPAGVNRLAAIQKYAREAENSMIKSIRELGKLQTEDQFRHEICPVTEAQFNDAGQLKNTPHDRSEACGFQQILKTLIANHKYEIKARTSLRHAEAAAIATMSPEAIRQFEANRTSGVKPPATAKATAA
jgi:hypothetical protein